MARRYRWLLAGVVLCGVLLRVVLWVDFASSDPFFDVPALDSRVYLPWAGEIAGGDLLAGDEPFFLNPLYAYFLAPFVLGFGEEPILAIRLTQILLGLLSVLLVAGAVRRLVGPGTALLSAFLLATFPLLAFYELTVMIVTLAVFLNALSLFLLARFAERKTLPSALVAGLSLGLAILARPNVGLFLLLLPLWFILLAPPRGRLRFVVLRTGALFGGAFLMILPVAIRNHLVSDHGDFVLVTWSAGTNLWVSNGPDARRTGNMQAPELRPHPVLIRTDSRVVVAREQGGMPSPSEVSAWWTERTLRSMAEEPGASALFLLRKFLAFLSPYEIPSSYDFESARRDTSVVRLLPLGHLLISPLALIGVILAVTRMARETLPFAFLWIAYAVGLTIFYPLAHYRAPVVPGSVVLAAIALSWLTRGFRVRDGRVLIRAGFALLVAVVVVHANRLARAAGVESLAPIGKSVGAWEVSRGLLRLERYRRTRDPADLNRAEEWFEAAHGMQPGTGLALKGLASVAWERREFGRESIFLEEALALRPGDPDLLSDLGANRLRAGRVEEALLLFEVADRRMPGHPGTIVEIARCLRLLGRPEEAETRAREGLDLDPASGPLHLEMAFLLAGRGAPREEVARHLAAARDAGLPVPEPLQQFLE